MSQLPYYNYNKICSYNATYNMIVGGRGLGKTFGILVKAVKDFIKRGEQFIYLRRYKAEMSNARATFANDFAYLFPKFIFRVNGMEAQMARAGADSKDKNAWLTIGYFAALTGAQSMKSMTFPKVTKIIFDEFILEKGFTRYIPNEDVVFNNFYNTVDRWQDRVVVYFLANSVSIMNPYFMRYDINPEDCVDGFLKKADGYLVAHFPDAKLFAAKVFESKFGKFIQNTDPEYAEYAVGNQFADNNSGLINPKSSRERYQYTLETKQGTFSIWKDPFTKEYTIQQKRPKEEILFTMVIEKMSEDKVLLTRSSKLLQTLRGAFNTARVTFDAPPTRNVFSDIFK